MQQSHASSEPFKNLLCLTSCFLLAPYLIRNCSVGSIHKQTIYRSDPSAKMRNISQLSNVSQLTSLMIDSSILQHWTRWRVQCLWRNVTMDSLNSNADLSKISKHWIADLLAPFLSQEKKTLQALLKLNTIEVWKGHWSDGLYNVFKLLMARPWNPRNTMV